MIQAVAMSKAANTTIHCSRLVVLWKVHLGYSCSPGAWHRLRHSRYAMTTPGWFRRNRGTGPEPAPCCLPP